MGLRSWVKDRFLYRTLGNIRDEMEEREEGDFMKELWNRIVKFMDGKKTYTGLALAAVPAIAAGLATMMPEAGFDLATTTKVTTWVSGGLLTVVGVAHKIVKWMDDQTPSEPPNRF